MVVFDKTGTLTHGRPTVVQAIIFVSKAVCPTHLFTAILGLAESRSEHPLGVAIAEFATQVIVQRHRLVPRLLPVSTH